MRIPLFSSDRIRDMVSNAQKTNTMVVEPVEQEWHEKPESERLESMRSSYQKMLQHAHRLPKNPPDAVAFSAEETR